MDWQLLIVAGAVTLAALYLLRQTWRTWFGRKPVGCGGCGTSCGAKPAEPAPPADGKLFLPADRLTVIRRGE
jgi:hypothetical protein